MSVRRRPSYRTEQFLDRRRHRASRRAFRVEHVPIELGRPANGLARVVDDEVEPVVRRAHVLAEALDARRVPQVEPEDLQSVTPLVEIRLPVRIASQRRAGSAS